MMEAIMRTGREQAKRMIAGRIQPRGAREGTPVGPRASLARSQQRYADACAAGHFRDEIVPVE